MRPRPAIICRHMSIREKMSKTGRDVMLQLVETPDIVATLVQPSDRTSGLLALRWKPKIDDFARSLRCSEMLRLMVSNGPSAIDSLDNEVEVLDPSGSVLATIRGTKEKRRHTVLWISFKQGSSSNDRIESPVVESPKLSCQRCSPLRSERACRRCLASRRLAAVARCRSNRTMA